METKRTCAIVQDLLPAYIDKLTKPETTAFVDAHLTDCESCRRVCRAMSGALPAEAVAAEAVVQRLQMKRHRRLALLWSIAAVVLLGAMVCLLPWHRSINVTHQAVIWRCGAPEEEQLTAMRVTGTYQDFLFRQDHFTGSIRVEAYPETHGNMSVMDVGGGQFGIWYETEDARMKAFGSMFIHRAGSVLVLLYDEEGHWDGATGMMITAPATTREEAVALANALADELDPDWLGSRDFE